MSATIADRATLVAHLRATCKAERQRGVAGHWTYDAGRHRNLLDLYRVEAGELAWLLDHSKETTPC